MESESSSSSTIQFTHILDLITNFKSQLTILQDHMKVLEKTVKKEMKVLKTQVEKSQKKSKVKKVASGFAKPSTVTNELCAFMNKEDGSKIARTDVTKALIEYINHNNLKNSENKRIINPDDKLKLLLGIDEGDKVTYFNIQKFMNKHFIKSENNHSIIITESEENC